MPASFVGVSSASTTGTSLTGTVPTGTQVGDVMAAFFVKTATAGTMAAHADWTAIPGGNEEVSQQGLEYGIWRRTADAGDTAGSTTQAFTSSSSLGLHLVIVTLRGIDTADPFEGYVSFLDAVTGTSHAIDASSISPPGDAMVLYAAAWQVDDITWTAPSGFTEAFDAYAQRGWTIDYKAVSAGSLGTITGTSSGSRRVRSIVVALNAASSGSGDTATMGVATGSGVAPTSSVGASAGVAPAAGVAPTVGVSASVGTATASGLSPTTTTTVAPTPGVATATGISPGSSVTLTPAPGVATTLGISPTDGTLDTTPVPGAATGSGISPTSSTTTGTGAASGTGVSPLPSAVAGIGSATGQGIDAGSTTVVSMSTVTAAGIDAAAAALVEMGTAVGVGVTPGESTPDVIPGPVTAYSAAGSRVRAADPGTIHAASGGSV